MSPLWLHREIMYPPRPSFPPPTLSSRSIHNRRHHWASTRLCQHRAFEPPVSDAPPACAKCCSSFLGLIASQWFQAMRQPVCGVCCEPFGPESPPLTCESCGLQVHAPCYGYPAFPFPRRAENSTVEPDTRTANRPLKRSFSVKSPEKLENGSCAQGVGQSAWSRLSWRCVICWSHLRAGTATGAARTDSRADALIHTLQDNVEANGLTSDSSRAQRTNSRIVSEEENVGGVTQCQGIPQSPAACIRCPHRDHRLAVKPFLLPDTPIERGDPTATSCYIHVVCALADPMIEPTGIWECLDAFQYRVDERLESDAGTLNGNNSIVMQTPPHVSQQVKEEQLVEEAKPELRCALCQRSDGLRFFCWVPPMTEKNHDQDKETTCSVVFHPVCALVEGWWRPEPRFVFQGHLRVSCPQHAVFACRPPISWLAYNESLTESSKSSLFDALRELLENLFLSPVSQADDGTVLFCLGTHILPETYDGLRGAMSQSDAQTTSPLMHPAARKALAPYTEEMQVAIVFRVAEHLGFEPSTVLSWLECGQVSAALLRWIQSDSAVPTQPLEHRLTRRERSASRAGSRTPDGVSSIAEMTYTRLWSRLLHWQPQRPYPKHCGWVETTERPLYIQARALLEGNKANP